MRASGTMINSNIVIGIGRGIILKTSKLLLNDHGEPLNLSKEWAKSVLRRMGYSKRRANSKSKLLLSDFIQLKTQFLLDLKACVEFKEIPHKLIINWDQTGLKIGPTTSWTMEKKGAKRVELVALDDKQQITAVFGCTLKGDFLPLQVIYRGKTTACLPKFKFPDDLHATFTANHWANERTVNDYINCIIILYEGKMQAALKLPPDYTLLWFFMMFLRDSLPSL